MKTKKFLPIFLAFCLMFNITALGKTVSSEGDADDLDEPIECLSVDVSNTNFEINAKSAVLIEPYTGQVLFEKNSSDTVAPASITKIMSLLLIMEAIENKSLTVNEVVTASDYAAGMGGSQIWLKEGESMTVDDLLKAVVIGSANDATVALAEKIAGSEQAFVSLMNKKAKELGMENTNFVNCTGLDAEEHFSSAYDVAVMSCELIKYPLIKKYSTVWTDTLRNGESELVNTNKLVRFYDGTTGLKTGTTSAAGCCLSASAKRGNTELVAVIMGADSSKVRFSAARSLLDYGFANYEYIKIKPDAKQQEFTVSVKNGTEKSVICKPCGDVKALIKKSDYDKTEKKVVIKKSLNAPVKKGKTVGCIEVYVDKEQIGSIDIKAQNAVEKIKYLTVLGYIFKGLVSI